MSDLVNRRQAAELVGRQPGTLARWERIGVLNRRHTDSREHAWYDPLEVKAAALVMTPGGG